MSYRFALERQDYTHLSSGRVFYNLPGHPAFPVRLASEIFQRSLNYLSAGGFTGPVSLYDPVCGGAYHLAVIACLHWHQIAEIRASDIDAAAVAIAGRNLSLLTRTGMLNRMHELAQHSAEYGKASHRAALESAAVLKAQLEVNLARHSVAARVFQADALDGQQIQAGLGNRKVNLVISDVPYGLKSNWESVESGADPTAPILSMLDNLLPVLASHAVVAVAATKQVRSAHPAYIQLGKMKLGLRQVTFLKPA